MTYVKAFKISLKERGDMSHVFCLEKALKRMYDEISTQATPGCKNSGPPSTGESTVRHHHGDETVLHRKLANYFLTCDISEFYFKDPTCTNTFHLKNQSWI